MTHYVCTGGCRGVSDEPNKTCGATDCPKLGHQLTPCNCSDEKHTEAYSEKGEEGGVEGLPIQF